MGTRTRRAQAGLAAAVAALALVPAAVLPAPASSLLRAAALLLCTWAAAAFFRAGARLRRARPLPCPWFVALPVLVAATWWVNPALVQLDLLASWDNPVHAWHATRLVDHLPALRAWTMDQAFGMGHGEDYALFVYLPAALLHVVTGRLVPLDTCVAVEVLVAAVLLPWAAWGWLAPRVGPWPALAGAVLLAWDGGWFHQAGTVPLVGIGLWPFRLSLAFSVATLWAATRFLESPRARTLAVTACCAVVAVQSHVAGFTYLGFGLVVLAAAWRWDARQARAAWPVVAVTLGAMLSAGWLVLPWLAQSDFFLSLPAGEAQYPTLLDRALSLSLLNRNRPLEAALQVLGAWMVWRQDRFAGRLVVSAWVAGYLLITPDMLPALLPPSLRTLAASLQYPRFETLARALAVVAGGCAAWWLGARVVRAFLSARRPGRVLATVVVGAGLLVALGEGWRATWDASALKAVRGTARLEDVPAVRGVRQAAAAVRSMTLPVDALVVVDVVQVGRGPLHLAAEFQRWSNVPVVQARKQGAVVWVDYTRREQFTAEELLGGGPTHWLSTSGRPPVPGCTELGRYDGGVVLFELPRRAPDQRVSSVDDVKVLQLDADGVELQGPSTGFTATLRLRAAPGWHVVDGPATLDRGPLFPGSPTDFFTRVGAPAGVTRVRLAREGPPSAASGMAVSLLGLLLAGTAFLRGKSPQKTEPR